LALKELWSMELGRTTMTRSRRCRLVPGP